MEAVLRYLAPQAGESYLDLTAGYGGHASRILGLTQAPAQTTLVDRDSNAVHELAKVFAGSAVEIINQDFLSASRLMQEQGKQFDMILADIGVSSPHLNNADRGFAFAHDGPLDMRMDQTQELTAATIVNTYSEDDLTTLLQDYGEEPKARRIARSIVERRQTKQFDSTAELAALVARAWPGHNKVHPATRTFQALRIAVNDELGQLQTALPIWQQLLKPGGRLAVISFHSLEDRIVKQSFAELSGNRYDAELTLLTKHPVTAETDEIAINPRARSAKLRAVLRK